MDVRKLMQTGEGIEQLEQNLLNLDSTFIFKCQRCGKCCKNQDMVFFTPHDVFKIAKKLGKMPEDVIKDYAEVYIGSQSRIPLVHLLMQGRRNACPFLQEDNRCSIHDAKPVICALYPLGRVMTAQKPGETIHGNPERMVRYIMSVQCGAGKKRHTVQEWLEDFGIPTHDEFFQLWTEVIVELGVFVRDLERKGITEQALQPIWSAMFYTLYVDYDMSQEFFPQFRQNSDKDWVVVLSCKDFHGNYTTPSIMDRPTMGILRKEGLYVVIYVQKDGSLRYFTP